MAIKKSELYSSLWASCDELRGSMDASQYKDYVLVMLYIKYVSDKYADVTYGSIEVPKGASFKDMVALKGSADIGDKINKKIIEPLKTTGKLLEVPNFNDPNKLGQGKEMVDRLTNLIAIFENPALDFGKNRADDDDIMGDAYEYLMRHFATESGKSKGQFYTPAEVSRIIAKVIGITKENTQSTTEVYDPTCGSGSLLLKVAEQAGKSISIYGQEKDSATSGLARMNMILHNNPSSKISMGNTLANPQFVDEKGNLKTFDYVVANPPFSDKRWSAGVFVEDELADKFHRFIGFGVPPEKNGDYAYLLHIIRSLKHNGKGACILPHGVLFRGNAEAEIRKKLIQKGYIKGIIGLPANLFYGTGIPACLIVIDKENAHNRKAIFMIDASKGFMKDGNKNRLRERDIHRVVDVFNNQLEIPKYSRIIPFTEIERNEFNLNIPRYIDNQEEEDIQDIFAHLNGGIPKMDIDKLQNYWKICPNLKNDLFVDKSEKYYSLKVEAGEIKETICNHKEFINFTKKMQKTFEQWKQKNTTLFKNMTKGIKPKEVISSISEDILNSYDADNIKTSLVEKYDIYQHLMDYWQQEMQDDCYLISEDGWKAETYRIIVKNKKTNKDIDKGWTCDLIPKNLIIEKYFFEDYNKIEKLKQQTEEITGKLQELEEEHNTEGGYFGDFDKVNKLTIQNRLKEITNLPPSKMDKEEKFILEKYLTLLEKQSKLNVDILKAEIELDNKAYNKYPLLTIEEIKTIVVDDKWMKNIEKKIKQEIESVSQKLTQRIKGLAERYQSPLPLINNEVNELENKVKLHLQKMGFTYNN